MQKKYQLDLMKLKMKNHLSWIDEKFGKTRDHILVSLQIKLAYLWKRYRIRKAKKLKEENERKRLAAIEKEKK